MATDPERPIEKLLRAAGRTREQADRPTALHPATRRLLHGEVARRYRQPASGSSRIHFGILKFRPRFAWGLALVVGLGLAAAVFLPPRFGSQKTATFAANKIIFRPQPAPEPQAAPSSAASVPASRELPPAAAPLAKASAESDRSAANPQAGFALRADAANDMAKVEERLTSDKDLALSLNQIAASTNALAAGAVMSNRPRSGQSQLADAAPTSAPSAAFEGAALRQRYGLAASRAPAPSGPPAATPPPGEALSFAAPAAQPSAANALRIEPMQPERVVRAFVQADAMKKEKLAAGAPFAVLTAFQLEQSGRELRIIDQDGSVYKGVMVLGSNVMMDSVSDVASPTSAVASGGLAAQPNAERKIAHSYQAAPAVAAPAAPAYSFRVTGTNLTLRLPVVFSGTVLPPSNAVYRFQASNAITAGSPGALPLPLLNSRVAGQAVVGGRKLDINAVPKQ